MASGKKSRSSGTASQTSALSDLLLTAPQREAIDAAFERGLSPLRLQEPMRCSEWAAKHFWLSPESSATEGEFDPWPYQVAILDCMGNDDIRKVTFRKSARIGYTKMLTAATGYFHHHKRRNVVIYQPTDSDAKEFCKDTIDPMVRDCSVIRDLMRSSGKNNKENTLQTKYFLGSSLHIRGGTSANNYRRLTKDVVIYDELDGFDSDIEGEGNPTSLGDKRVNDSSFPKSIRGTTPTVHGQSLIQHSEEEADLVFRFGVECLHCQERQAFEWGGPDVPHGFKWTGDDPESTHYVCRSCYGHWHYSDIWALQETGRWESEDGHWIDEESNLRSPEGVVIEWPRHVAFVLWSAYSLTFPWPDMVYEFLDAKDDPESLKTFVNTTLGEWWKETITQVEADPLYARREPYRAPPVETRLVTFGADVQVDRIEVEFVGWGSGEESWSLDYVVLPGDTQKPEVWAALAREIRRTFRDADGRELRARCGCVDSGYLPDEVYKFSRDNGVLFAIPIKGASVPGKPVARMPRGMHKEHRVYLTEVGSDTAKEVIYRRLLMEHPGKGFMHYPNTTAYDEEYFRQLTGEEKRPVKRQGRKVMAFQQAYANVEALDCRVYALAAARIAQDRLRVDLDRATTVPSSGSPSSGGNESPARQRRQQRRGRSSSSWFNR